MESLFEEYVRGLIEGEGCFTFYKKLRGNKGVQFENWLNKIGDPEVPYPFRRIYDLYKNGYYDGYLGKNLTVKSVSAETLKT